MSTEHWWTLTSLEQSILINAREFATLVGIFGDLDEEDAKVPLSALQQEVISFVDRGLVELRRYEPWIAPDGRVGEAPTGLLSLDEQRAELLNDDNWEVVGGSYVGAVTLVETDLGIELKMRLAAEKRG